MYDAIVFISRDDPDMTVRTRVAPSPTGDPHVGTAYMALFARALALQHGGQFVLRIEDTDVARSTEASEQNILSSLSWLGLTWDEGPDCGGPHGPYRQSERLSIYREHVDQLVQDGHAFHCFCTAERLSEMRAAQVAAKQTARYDGHCMSLSREETERRLSAGEENVVRMKVPHEGNCTFNDRLRGEISIDYAQVDMQVLLKSDGFPTYHLAVVVDDHLMGITHIIRGEEWIPSAPKHKLLYEYFGWEMPELIHMPLLRNPDKSKLSKRKNPTSIRFYERMGFLPEAMINYLGMLGWSMPDGEEKFSMDEMYEAFDVDRISLGEPVFDVDKLRWLNGRWLRESLSDEEVADRLSDWALNRSNLLAVLPIIKERIDVLSDVVPMTGYLASGMLDIDETDFDYKQNSQEDMRDWLQFIDWMLERQDDWARDTIESSITGLAEALDVKIRNLLFPVFVAIAGRPVSPPLYDSMVLLGPDMSRARLRHAIEILGGVSKKQAKRLEKRFAELQSSLNQKK